MRGAFWLVGQRNPTARWYCYTSLLLGQPREAARLCLLLIATCEFDLHSSDIGGYRSTMDDLGRVPGRRDALQHLQAAFVH